MQEVYTKLNNYLNDWFVRVEKEDPVFHENLYNIFLVTNSICKRKLDDSIYEKIENPGMDFVTCIFYARQIIESIDCGMLEKFDEVLSNGIININEEFDENDNSYYATVYNDQNLLIREQIELKLDHTTDDIRKIVHEFIHLYLEVPNRSQNYKFLIEFFSTYFEEYARNFMDMYDDESLKFSCISRINVFLQSVNFIQHFIIILLTYKNLGDLNDKSQIELKEICHINYKTFEKKCCELLKLFESGENDLTYNYKYIVGTILAYYCKDKLDVKHIIDFAKKVNTSLYSEMDIFELLKQINISLNFELISNVIDQIEDVKKINKCYNTK